MNVRIASAKACSMAMSKAKAVPPITSLGKTFSGTAFQRTRSRQLNHEMASMKGNSTTTAKARPSDGVKNISRSTPKQTPAVPTRRK